MRVLIADDDPIAIELLRDALTDAGHDVACAADGAAALAALTREPFQVLVTDWEMPGIDGLGLCRAVRGGAAGAGEYVYVILLTGHGSVAERVRGLSAGADDFMTKPFDPAELQARMQAAERLLSLETRDVAIFAMAKLAESRDVETGTHLERVMNYARILAQQLPAIGRYVDEIDAEFVRLVYSTSPLHDIGKVGIPDGVLLKPGRLDDREFEVMKTHTSIGAQTLDAALRRFPNAKFLRMARDIAASHHERWDGKGYPAGLAGTAIPLAARIVALADVYDALTSRRVYKSAFAHDVARGIIVADTGTHFDPAVVEAFVAAEAAFVAVHRQYHEGPAAMAA
ncbi:MAG TPA: HD domain-containing phosphohydrolase [Tepidisphaeraceae bacterium]|nr:HD domain-containing phosphohydrolase [Tepidisphaeraceae bacterium]